MKLVDVMLEGRGGEGREGGGRRGEADSVTADHPSQPAATTTTLKAHARMPLQSK